MNDDVLALTVHDDGAGGGPALYAGGAFFMAAGSLNRVAWWDGSSCSPLGSGMNHEVFALAAYDDGSVNGPALYAGGAFTVAGGVFTNWGVARWNGSSWSTVGGGTNAFVQALAVHYDGAGGGPALCAGGDFTTAGVVAASRIAKWDGSSWSPLGSGMNGTVYAMTTCDELAGSGPALFAAGGFSASPAGDSYLARWGCPLECIGDATEDGIVDVQDLVAVITHWGPCA